MWKNPAAYGLFGALILLIIVCYAMFKIFPAYNDISTMSNALALSIITLAGLALVVVLMAGLVTTFWALELQDGSQPLGLPEGSIRALIAFSLILAFVCISAFLYSGTTASEVEPNGKSLSKITESQLQDLKQNFVVAYQQSRDASGSAITAEDKKPLYEVSYFSKRNKSSDDFAKQIFTTLATVFVSVVSFYFGSSTTLSAARQSSGGQNNRLPEGGSASRKPNDPKSGDPKSGDPKPGDPKPD